MGVHIDTIKYPLGNCAMYSESIELVWFSSEVNDGQCIRKYSRHFSLREGAVFVVYICKDFTFGPGPGNSNTRDP